MKTPNKKTVLIAALLATLSVATWAQNILLGAPVEVVAIGAENTQIKKSENGESAVSPNSLPTSAPVTTQVSAPQASKFDVSPADQNFRKVLTRWSKDAGWTFEPEHWTVARDIPVSGSDSVVSDYKSAVRRLLQSTKLTDLPVQPCFYSNNVLRVIPASELCSRSEN